MQTVSQQYQRTERKVENMEVAEAKAEAEVSKVENEKIPNTDDVDSNIIRIIKNILSVKDKLGGDDEAGIAKDAIEYLEKLLAFLNGDKKVLLVQVTGAVWQMQVLVFGKDYMTGTAKFTKMHLREFSVRLHRKK